MSFEIVAGMAEDAVELIKEVQRLRHENQELRRMYAEVRTMLDEASRIIQGYIEEGGV